MEILKHGTFKYTPIKFHGICKRCGCIFETTILFSEMKDGTIIYEHDDELENFSVKKGKYICSCPECGLSHVQLIDTD